MRARDALVVFAVLCACAPTARAEQRRDWMLSSIETGDHLLLDYFGTGGQLTLEHRRPIYGSANDYAFSAATLVGYPLAQVTGSASLRILFLELSGTVGYRTLWRNLSFAPGTNSYCMDCDRPARRARDPIFGPGYDTDRYVFAEARAQIYAPLNEYFVLTSLLGTRYEGAKPRSYDWFYTDIHDGGIITRWETLAFIKHRALGGIGPYFQMLWLPRAGHHEMEAAIGFNAVTRLGLVARHDLVFLTFLIRPGDGYYGQHSYFAPIRALITYRLQLDL